MRLLSLSSFPFFGRALSVGAVAVCGLAAMGVSAQTGTAVPQDFIARYQARVSKTQAEQPHWVTPLVTVTPRLEQEIRFDFVRQTNQKLFNTWNFGNSKGLELIPERHVELLFNLPPYFSRDGSKIKDGFGDVSMVAKWRFYARNEEHGNAILTAFVNGTVPTGKKANGNCCAVVTPTLAAGKGIGLFAVTTTLGGSLPVTNSKGLGHTITWNTAVQYRLAKTGTKRFFWPEVESNASIYRGGPNDGRVQWYLTPGLIVGRIPLTHDASGKPGRLGLTFGAGEQIAASAYHANNHNLVFTVRMPF